MDLDGKVALITGAGGGIAGATAEALAERGCHVAAADLDPGAAERTAERVRGAGAEALALEGDVSERADVDRIVAASVDRFGGLDICVNAVGIGGRAEVAEHPDDLWDRILAVNLTSAFLVSRAVLPHLVGRGGGRIVNITSRAAYWSRAGTAAYAASKGGLLAFSRVLAVEAGAHGITVNNVAPGTTVTPMVEQGIGGPDAQAREAVESGVLIEPRRLTQPDEIASAVVYLCGPGSDHVTGTTVHVNGGSYCP